MTTKQLSENPVYVAGLDQPLEVIADLLDGQNKPHYAEAVRVAILVINRQSNPCVCGNCDGTDCC